VSGVVNLITESLGAGVVGPTLDFGDGVVEGATLWLGGGVVEGATLWLGGGVVEGATLWLCGGVVEGATLWLCGGVVEGGTLSFRDGGAEGGTLGFGDGDNVGATLGFGDGGLIGVTGMAAGIGGEVACVTGVNGMSLPTRTFLEFVQLPIRNSTTVRFLSTMVHLLSRNIVKIKAEPAEAWRRISRL
jgi:hypothetical protein